MAGPFPAKQRPDLYRDWLVGGGSRQASCPHYPYLARECKPHMASAIHQNGGMKKAQLRQILARNLQMAMERTPGADTQQALAKRAGVGQSHVSRILRGESAATIDVIAAMCEALNIQPWELLSDEESTRQAAMEKMLGGRFLAPVEPMKRRSRK